MENKHVIGGLIRKRAELAGHLEAAQSTVTTLFNALYSLDATIRLFSPETALDEIKPKRVAHRRAAQPGQNSRVIKDALREAVEPLTSGELTLRVMASRGMNAEDRNLFLMVQKRVLASLRNLKIRERVQAQRHPGGIG